MPEAEQELVEQARISEVGGSGPPVLVHFNPETLEFTLSNTLKSKGRGSKKKQHVTQSSAKLSMTLIFDTTLDGTDVRIQTSKIGKFMEPEGKTPSVVLFEWGAYKFQGMVEKYKETIEFFAAGGIPLRSKLALTLASQDEVFEVATAGQRADVQANFAPEPVQASAPPGRGATDTATRAGNPAAARALGAANGEENLRFPSASLEVGASIELRPAVAFAVGGGAGLGAGIGVSAGLGLELDIDAGLDIEGGLGAGATLGAGAGAGLAAGVGAGVGFGAGGGLGAGGSATLAPFAGLRGGTRTSGPARARLDVRRLLPEAPTVELATDRDASFELGGRARLDAGVSLRANVGTGASLRDRIQFDEE